MYNISLTSSCTLASLQTGNEEGKNSYSSVWHTAIRAVMPPMIMTCNHRLTKEPGMVYARMSVTPKVTKKHTSRYFGQTCFKSVSPN